MRKWMALIIIAVYIGSVFFIAFFGAALATFNPIMLVNRIEIVNEDVELSQEGHKWVRVDYQQGMVYALKWKCYPEDASDKRVEFIYTPSQNYEVSFYGEILIVGLEPIVITIRALDGGGAMDSLEILPIRTA